MISPCGDHVNCRACILKEDCQVKRTYKKPAVRSGKFFANGTEIKSLGAIFFYLGMYNEQRRLMKELGQMFFGKTNPLAKVGE